MAAWACPIEPGRPVLALDLPPWGPAHQRRFPLVLPALFRSGGLARADRL
ncbi:MAG: hypothetical protein RMK29_19965 [Myxococcales bacterium]|nr:hypothetical protein [Myxococcota bacterium]MDW8283986.1 hypothetical protein [Myxococcales bacterium]